MSGNSSEGLVWPRGRLHCAQSMRGQYGRFPTICTHFAGGGRPAQNAGLMPTAGRRGMGASRATSTLFGAPVGMGMAVVDERLQALSSGA